ncbi:MAG: YsnF/AvaK domain-containing protein [Gemmatimonadetes bacterium]|nr:YsnF/AvaK domain-containing protein [Gemmatimonadota bacterium]
MFDKLFNGGDQDENDAAYQERQLRIRERMQAHGVTEEEATRLVLSEEELTVGKRAMQAGEVEVSKRVETERVQQPVTLRHDEVEVERRPITDGFAAAGATIGESEEVRIPLHAEQAVVEKHIVPKEEVVVRTREVAETEMVEADLRKERADVHREGAVRETDHLRTDPALGRNDQLS